MSPIKEADEVVDECLARLGEYFESGIILLSYRKDGETYSWVAGMGDYFAQKGLVDSWLDKQKLRDMAQQIKQAIEEEE